MHKHRLSKTRIKWVVILSIMIVVAVSLFVLPNPNAYILEKGMNYEKKNYYSLYITFRLQSLIEDYHVYDENPESVYGERKLTMGGEKSLIFNGKNYFFHRTKENDKVLVVIENTDSNSQKSYSIIDLETYNYFVKVSGYTDYDHLLDW